MIFSFFISIHQSLWKKRRRLQNESQNLWDLLSFPFYSHNLFFGKKSWIFRCILINKLILRFYNINHIRFNYIINNYRRRWIDRHISTFNGHIYLVITIIWILDSVALKCIFLILFHCYNNLAKLLLKLLNRSWIWLHLLTYPRYIHTILLKPFISFIYPFSYFRE